MLKTTLFTRKTGDSGQKRNVINVTAGKIHPKYAICCHLKNIPHIKMIIEPANLGTPRQRNAF